MALQNVNCQMQAVGTGHICDCMPLERAVLRDAPSPATALLKCLYRSHLLFRNGPAPAGEPGEG